MTVLQIAPSYRPSLGGVEKHVEQLSKELEKLGHKVIVLTLKEKLNKFIVWREIIKNRHLFFQADIIQIHDVFWWILPLYPFIKNKVYLTHHGWEGQYPIPLKNKIQRFFYANLSKKLIHIGKYIQEFYWEKPDLILYGGASKFSKPKILSNKKINLVFLGRLELENDLNLCFKFLDSLKKTKNKFIIIFIGDGSLKKQCQKYGKVTGMISNPNKYLKQADFVIASSYLSILEAQALGKIIIAFASNNLKQSYLKFYSGKKFLILTSPPKAAKKIISLKLNKNKYLNLSQSAYDFAKQQSWKKITKEYLNLWQPQ